MIVGFGAVLIGDTIGLVTGTISGYVGGRWDLFGQRLLDMLLAFPGLILASLFAAILRHVAPQTIAPFLVIVSLHLGISIIAEARLSFLGTGVPPPAPSWGHDDRRRGQLPVQPAVVDGSLPGSESATLPRAVPRAL